MVALDGAEACAAIVERDDPHLYATTLFAPEPARSRLMVLYAFDCELSRASQASRESLIPRMRLQWWRDAVTEAAAGGAPKAHEVAAPLHAVLGDGPLGDGKVLLDLIDGHNMVLDLPWTAEEGARWPAQRFQSLVDAAGALLGAGPMPTVGVPLANAFMLRNMARLAAESGTALVPGLASEDLTVVARGQLPERGAAHLKALAEAGLAALGAARAAGSDRLAVPALLPLFYAERTLARVLGDPEVIFGQLDEIDRPFDGIRLAWRALRGGW